MKLYYSDVLAPRKACAVARHLNSPVDYIYLDLARGEHKQPDYLALNPNGKVPTLVDGERIVWESNAVMCHLAEKAGSDLWPKDARQIEVVRWLSWDASHFTQYAAALYFEHIIRPRFGLGDPDPAVVDEATRDFRRSATVLDDHLRGRSHLVGDALTVADFAVAVTLPYAETAKIPMGDFAEIQRWHARLNEIEAWREPFPLQAAQAA